MNGNTIRTIIATVVGGFILALLVAECRQVRQTREEVIRLEQKLDDAKKTP